jgi:hypothetical protein
LIELQAKIGKLKLKYKTPDISCYDDELSTYLHKHELEFIVNNMDKEEEQWRRYAEALLGLGSRMMMMMMISLIQQ